MAPSAVSTTTTEQVPLSSYKLSLGDYKEIDPYSVDRDVETGKVGGDAAKYPHYLPTWNPAEKYEPLRRFEHYEHGKDADTSYPNLFPASAAAPPRVTHLTPGIGSEVSGVQLSSLTAAGKDELAHFVATRKVVAFRDQDFADLPIGEALA
ncbi:hypothetical protein E4U41_000323, partial [Claviceps citrina]